MNFYNNLKCTTPRKERPQIVSLQYGSLGWIELSLVLGVAVVVERVLKAIVTTLREANATYNEIHDGLSRRKLMRIEQKKKEIELARIHGAYIEESVQRMTRLLGLSDPRQMHQKTGSPLKTLKILLSLYRRVRILAEYETKGKLRL